MLSDFYRISQLIQAVSIKCPLRDAENIPPLLTPRFVQLLSVSDIRGPAHSSHGDHSEGSRVSPEPVE